MQEFTASRYVRAAGYALLVLGLTVSCGWAFKLTSLTTWGAVATPMVPLTAFCFVLAGVALVCDGSLQASRQSAWGAALFIAAALGLAQLLFDFDLGIGARVPNPGGTVDRFVMSEFTALCFMVAGVALILQRHARFVAVVWCLGAAVTLVGVLTVLDFLVTLGERKLPGLIALALPTAFGLVVLGVALLLSAGRDNVQLPLKVVLGAMVVASLLPAFVFMASQSRVLNDQHLLAIRTAGANAVDNVADMVALQLKDRIALLRGLSTSPVLQAAADAAPSAADIGLFHRQLQNAMRGEKGWIILTTADGSQLANSRRLVDGAAGPRLTLPTIAIALQTGQPQISDLHSSETRADVTLVSISFPVPNQPLALNWRIPVGEFSDELKRAAPDGWTMSLSDRTGRVIARNRNPEQWVGKAVTASAWSKARTAIEGFDRTLTLEGTPVLTNWRRLQFGWTAFTGAPEALLDKAGSEQTRRLGIGAVIMTALGLLFATLGARVISKPLLKFSAIGDLTPPVAGTAASGAAPQTPVREINMLSRALTEAANQRKRATSSLAESEARLQRFVDQAPAAIAMFDTDMHYLAASQRWKNYFAPSEGELIGRAHYDVFQRVPARWREFHRRGLAGEVIDADNDEFIALDGRRQFVRWELRPWHTSNDQIGGITIFAEDVSERARTELALRESEARLGAIVDTATDAIVVVDATGAIVSFNRAAETMFGYASSEATGQNFSVLMPQPEGAADQAALKALAGVAAHAPISGREVTAIRKDGGLVPLELSVAEWTVGGRQYFTGIMRDITIRKERENHVRVVMRELSHRTKNALAVVQAMAWQTSRRTKDAAEFQQQFTQRVDGLSRSIGLLVRSEWEGVLVQDLVEGQLAPFLDDAENRLRCDGPRLVLKPNAAQDLGLVLHELATNASKYGALSNMTGRVLTKWSVTPPEVCKAALGKNVLRFEWREIGGPPTHAPTHHGFGTTLIKDMLAKTYRAQIRMDFEVTGLVWLLDVDVDRVVIRETTVVQAAG